MNVFLTILLLSLVAVSKCIDFCDVLEFDVVFNVGHHIHMIRCGEVWVFDPRLYRGRGGLVRDYSWFGMARKRLGQEIVRQHRTFDRTKFHFAAWSFQDIECEDPLYDLERDCRYSAQHWNTLSFMAINHTIISFKYDVDFDLNMQDLGPFKLNATADLTSNPRLYFWPNLTKFQPTFDWEEFPEHPYIYSALFYKENYRLFLVLKTRDGTYFCLTHIDMKSMIFDFRLWPRMSTSQDRFKWASPHCFTGNVVGMFVKDSKPYIVGRVLYDNRQYADQVYAMNAGDDSKVEIEVVNVQGYDHPLNLRTFFGCPIYEEWFEQDTEAPPTQAPSTSSPQPAQNERKKRSIEEREAKNPFNWEVIARELRDDWLQLSVMAFASFFLIYLLFTLWTH